MKKTAKVFVYVKKDISAPEVRARKNEIGILEENDQDLNVIFFVISGQRAALPTEDFEIFDPKQTGDAFPNKVCNICHRFLPTTQFSRNQNGVNNRIIRRPSCDECRKTIDGVPVLASERRKWHNIRPDLEPFKCPICQKTTVPGLTSKVVLDHDHSNGRIRGWICDSCNTGIGRFKDNISLLEKAIIYLQTK